MTDAERLAIIAEIARELRDEHSEIELLWRPLAIILQVAEGGDPCEWCNVSGGGSSTATRSKASVRSAAATGARLVGTSTASS